MATPTPSSQQTTPGNTPNNAQSLPRFGEFALEIRLMIWKEALRDEQEGRAVIFDKHAMRILPTPRLVSPLLVTCSESRHEAFKVYTTCLNVYDMPLALSHGAPTPKGNSLPGRAVVRKHGRRSGKLRLSLSTDTFILDGGNDAIFCLRHSMERRHHLGGANEFFRDAYHPKDGYPHERAVSVRLSEDQASLVRRTLWIKYTHPQRNFQCLCTHTHLDYMNDVGSVIDVMSGRGAPRNASLNGAPTAILLFDNLEPWRVSELLSSLSGLPLRDFIAIDGDRATYLGTPPLFVWFPQLSIGGYRRNFHSFSR